MVCITQHCEQTRREGVYGNTIYKGQDGFERVQSKVAKRSCVVSGNKRWLQDDDAGRSDVDYNCVMKRVGTSSNVEVECQFAGLRQCLLGLVRSTVGF